MTRFDTMPGEKRRVKPLARLIDITGKIFGRLQVVKFKFRLGHSGYWLCKCNCGILKIISRTDLINGHTKSCGCLRNEVSGKRSKTAGIKHGLSRTKIYKVWTSMLQRCENEKCKSFKWYGKRGILVCQKWHDPKNFVQWALANGYKAGLTIERMNNNGNYEPDNCKWILQRDQIKNTRAKGMCEIN